MKLKYKIAKPTDLPSEDIVKKILSVIDENKYGIVSVTDSQVSFDDKKRLIVGNWEYTSRLNSGEFQIVKNGKSSVIVFDYYPIPLSDFIWVGIICAFFTGVGIIKEVYFAGLLSWIFIGQLIFKHYNLKNKAEQMLADVSS